jgi:stage III sporulation protein AG
LKSEPWKKIRQLKKDQLLILLLFGVLLLIIALPTESGEDKEEEEQAAEADSTGYEEQTDASYEARQEERLKNALAKVEGVGKAEVMITLKASSEKVVEKDVPTVSQTVEEEDSSGGKRSTQENSRTESTVYLEEDGDKIPYVVKELEPQVEGVIVIAEGGGDPTVQQNILEAVQALFSVEAHKIKIMKMEGSK